jgi:NADH-quinone oxidoreductase subunit J
MDFEPVMFWISGSFAVIGALGMVISKKAVHSALFLAFTMLNLAVLYAVQSAPFLAVAQVVVYTGAVMMLFLFVLMMVGVDSSDSLIEEIKGQRVLAILGGVGLIVFFIFLMGGSMYRTFVGVESVDATYGGNIQGLAALMFGKYVLIFEATAALLITAVLGAMILTHRERLTPKKSQGDLAKELFAKGDYRGPLPPPGVFARHNAVDTPALLPDGSVAQSSLPDAIVARGDVRPVDYDDIAEIQILSEGLGIVSDSENEEDK